MSILKNKLYRIYKKITKQCRDISEINYDELIELLKNNKNVILLDVRSMQEYKEYHLNSAINIPVYELSKKVSNIVISKENLIIVYCQSGERSKRAAKVLKQLGFKNIYNLKGRIKFNIMPKRLL